MKLLWVLSLLVSSIFVCMSFCSSLNSDGLSLLALKSAVDNDPTRVMTHWSESDPTPCHWSGIVCTNGRVTSLVLLGKSLSGYIPSELGLLDSLNRLDLAHNNFSKTVPVRLFAATKLRYIDLSHNSLSGPIPVQIKSMTSLNHLDFSSNHLNGSLPESLAELGSLAGTLNLSYNRFTGEIPPSYGRIPVHVSLDFSHNNLTGKVPQVGSLLNQGPIAFAGNSHLCGLPLQTPCEEIETVTSKPELQKPNPSVISNDDAKEEKKQQITGSVTVSLISGVSIVIGAVSISVWLIRKKLSSSDGFKTETKTTTTTVVSELDEEGQEGKFVAFDEGFELELEDLLRASAYVIGKSRSGIVYRVVAAESSSTVVAVRRLSDGNATWRFKEFVNEVETIGRINHPNIVRLRAYYYAEDEKLLITDFINNGSLYSALHGGPSNTRPPLSWGERLRIAQGTARGLMYIHEYNSRKYVHGNLKSSKILLDNEQHPHISGFGLSRLVSGYPKLTDDSISTRTQSIDQAFSARLSLSAPAAAYLAPEARVSSGCKSSQKSDVYSFGVILLELLTGRLPNGSSENEGEELVNVLRKWHKEERLLAEILDPKLLRQRFEDKQVLATIHVALNCTEMNPEMRPRMRSVSESLGRIKSD
ncbi:PREDICTED: receptor protein kinase-like protein ZAR1 [Camelina sativa]|uniref:Receptor protein kinase-like protein ZAR1 n=1 Tax=Camelina sativa TaxID=90675 RepID=A0ABM0YUG4_CAMSA|nr:PREDICTED: receptor protein kinase-like protein ZAR1 [Camelina sativa]